MSTRSRLSHLLLLALAAGATAPAALAAAPTVESDWRHVVGAVSPEGTGETIGDFDGDGIRDVAFLAHRALNDNGTVGIAIVGFDAVDGWRWRDMLPTPHRLIEPLLTHAGPDGNEILAVRLRRLPDATLAEELVRFGGQPLRELAVVPQFSPIGATLLASGDIDGDGDGDVLEHLMPEGTEPHRLRMRDVASGAVLWTSSEVPDISSHVVARLGQLDGDAALEVIVSGMPGRVLDGTLGALEWSYAGGFGERVVVGNFDNDGGDTEFASVGGMGAVVFRAAPYSPIAERTTPCCGRWNASGDLDGDGVDEWLMGLGTLLVVEPLDGSFTTIVAEDFYAESLAVADVDDDIDAEIVVNDFDNGSNPTMQIRDAPTFGVTFASTAITSPDLPLLVADLAGDGGEQLAFVAIEGGTVVLHVLDAASGEHLRQDTVTELQVGLVPGAVLLAAAQLDADPALELVIGNSDGGSATVVALDALDFGRVYTLADDVLPGGVRDLALGDIDANGTTELVIVSPGLQLRIFDAATGAAAGSAIALPDNGGDGLVLRNVDADPALEILVGDGRDVHAFDGATRLSEWSHEGGQYDSRVLVFERDGTCRLALYGDDGYREFPCGSGNGGAPLYEAPPLARVLPVDVDDGALLAISEGRFVAFDTATAMARPLSGYLGANAGRRQGSVVALDDGRIFHGNDGVVVQATLVDPTVFDDDFE